MKKGGVLVVWVITCLVSNFAPKLVLSQFFVAVEEEVVLETGHLSCFGNTVVI